MQENETSNFDKQYLKHGDYLSELADKEQSLLAKISLLASGGSWCAVVDLSERNTKQALTSLNRQIRRLEIKGLIELRSINNEVFCRLKDKGNSDNPYLLDVFQIS